MQNKRNEQKLLRKHQLEFWFENEKNLNVLIRIQHKFRGMFKLLKKAIETRHCITVLSNLYLRNRLKLKQIIDL